MPAAEPAAEVSAARPRRRHDPDRRQRIIDACLELIAEVGVDGVSHRRVAAAADVPLGSMTYHFRGRDELLHEAFERFTRTVSDRFESRMRTVTTHAEAIEAVVTIIIEDVFAAREDLVLMHELYTLAARLPAYRELTDAWGARSRAALERHFDPLTAQLVDALIEGMTIHRALLSVPQDRAVVTEAVRRVTGGT